MCRWFARLVSILCEPVGESKIRTTVSCHWPSIFKLRWSRHDNEVLLGSSYRSYICPYSTSIRLSGIRMLDDQKEEVTEIDGDIYFNVEGLPLAHYCSRYNTMYMRCSLSRPVILSKLRPLADCQCYIKHLVLSPNEKQLVVYLSAIHTRWLSGVVLKVAHRGLTVDLQGLPVSLPPNIIQS